MAENPKPKKWKLDSFLMGYFYIEVSDDEEEIKDNCPHEKGRIEGKINTTDDGASSNAPPKSPVTPSRKGHRRTPSFTTFKNNSPPNISPPIKNDVKRVNSDKKEIQSDDDKIKDENINNDKSANDNVKCANDLDSILNLDDVPKSINNLSEGSSNNEDSPIEENVTSEVNHMNQACFKIENIEKDTDTEKVDAIDKLTELVNGNDDQDSTIDYDVSNNVEGVSKEDKNEAAIDELSNLVNGNVDKPDITKDWDVIDGEKEDGIASASSIEASQDDNASLIPSVSDAEEKAVTHSKEIKELFKRLKRKISGLGTSKEKRKLTSSLSTESLSDAMEDFGRCYNDHASFQDF